MSTDLAHCYVGEVLRKRGVGYVDNGRAYVNTLWLRGLHTGRLWTAGLEDLLSYAAGHGRFDGVYLAAPIQAYEAKHYSAGRLSSTWSSF
ncbi:hypothetical protein [Gordonia terrae]|uniref:hypothetical protein n=1 Tax=Gordonia terrae TaxID=2055 RepID=UPI0011816729|nr:hypothetical protein [Gordonia terrae]